MQKPGRLKVLLETSSLLGWKSISNYALYKIRLSCGYYQNRPKPENLSALQAVLSGSQNSILPIVSREGIKKSTGSGFAQLIQTADDLIDGKIILFDGQPAQLDLAPHTPLLHWSEIERGKYRLEEDIKLIWEPARFSWAFTLARAFHLSEDTRYLDAFQKYLDAFNQQNPAYLGANWTSGQEAALRIIALSFAYHIFSQSSAIPDKLLQDIRVSIAENAARIPPTLCYARSQRNNHLISEAVGLYTAGLLLKGYTPASKWKQTGWKLFHQAILDQIADDGTYIQHSANYHRLMLDEAVWLTIIAGFAGEALPDAVNQKLAVATEYLYAMLDPLSGLAPNLGHQDGSNVLPLAAADHLDYRSTLQAAGRIFLKKDLFQAGKWDEKSAWLGIKAQEEESHPAANPYRLGNDKDWASIRVVQFHTRPAHADQLHVEIWHNGQNLALDAGTYLYNAPEPWRNALRTTLVHNTLSVDGLDQMLPTSRFMWLNWANAQVLSSDTNTISAQHDGYQKIGITQRRTLRSRKNGWEIEDKTLFSKNNRHRITLHWLLPDLPFLVKDSTIHFSNPEFSLQFSNDHKFPATLQIIRAGTCVHDSTNMDTTIYGWFSPTYAVKQAALSILYSVEIERSLTLLTEWNFPEKKSRTV